jgi:1,4-dihydroxy-2-naphthoate octaprenyltransferase
MSNFKIWMAQIRANFLLLAVFLVIIGLAFTAKYPSVDGQSFSFFHALLLVIGVVLSHISVNLFNEYSDFRTGIDFHTTRTPFTGGSGMITNGKTRPESVWIVATISLLVALAIGIYFTIIAHWTIIILSLIGGFSIVFYTNWLSKNILGELFAGLSLGTFVVIGTYIAMTATPGMRLSELLPEEVIWISIPPGILTSLLLFINQFPDVEADKLGGRKHLVIILGRKKASYIYAAGMLITFVIIVMCPLTGISSYWIYIALLPLPLAVKASIIAIKYGNDLSKLIPALVRNVITVLATDLLLAVGVFIDVF